MTSNTEVEINAIDGNGQIAATVVVPFGATDAEVGKALLKIMQDNPTAEFEAVPVTYIA
jgi:hypothetical protein